MSLRAFHIFLITCSIFLIGWLALWQIGIFGQTRSLRGLFIGVALLASAAGLATYLLWFLKKNHKKEN